MGKKEMPFNIYATTNSMNNYGSVFSLHVTFPYYLILNAIANDCRVLAVYLQHRLQCFIRNIYKRKQNKNKILRYKILNDKDKTNILHYICDENVKR